MIKHFFLVITILCILIFSSGCISSGENQTYSSNGIRFNYPSGWYQETPTNTQLNTGGINISVIAVVGDNNQKETGVIFQKANNTISLNTLINANKADIRMSGILISEDDITVDGVSAHEFVYKKTFSDGTTKKERMILLLKNNHSYIIIFTALPGDFDSQRTNFNLIKNSFKVQ